MKPVQSVPGADDAFRIYRRLLRYAAPHWGMFSIGVIGMALFAASDASIAWLTTRFFKDAFVKPDPRVLVFVPAGLFVLFLVRGIGDYVSNYFPGWVGRQVIKSLRGELFTHYLHLPSLYFDVQQSGQMLSRLTYNIELVAEASTNAVTVVIRDTLTIIGLVGFLLYLNWQLALFTFIAAPLISWLIRVANRAFRRYSTRIQNSMGDVTRAAKEAIDGQRLIKVFNAQDFEAQQFDKINERHRYNNMRLIMAKSVSNPVVQQIAAVALAGVMFVAMRQVLGGTMRVDQFIGFLTALMLLTAPLRRLVSMSGPLQQGIAAGASVFEMLDVPPEDQGGERPLQRARGDVEYRNVSFEYAADKGTVLREVSFSVRSGGTLAIVGRSGSGKSTLVSLLPRFYDPQSGSVCLDGHDVREYRLTDLRRQVSVVSQDVVLFDDTIRNNIAFGGIECTEDAIRDAARAAHDLDARDDERSDRTSRLENLTQHTVDTKTHDQAVFERLDMNVRGVLLNRLGKHRIDQTYDRRVVLAFQQVRGLRQLLCEVSEVRRVFEALDHLHRAA